jgi:hypothetical protein
MRSREEVETERARINMIWSALQQRKRPKKTKKGWIMGVFSKQYLADEMEHHGGFVFHRNTLDQWRRGEQSMQPHQKDAFLKVLRDHHWGEERKLRVLLGMIARPEFDKWKDLLLELKPGELLIHKDRNGNVVMDGRFEGKRSRPIMGEVVFLVHRVGAGKPPVLSTEQLDKVQAVEDFLLTIDLCLSDEERRRLVRFLNPISADDLRKAVASGGKDVWEVHFRA